MDGKHKKESGFQADIVKCAKLNGWRIDLADLHPKYLDPGFHGHLSGIAPRGKKLRAFFDFLLARRQHIFTYAYHTHDSRNSQKGYFDLTLIHPRRGRIILAELKRDGEYPKLEQRLWFAAAKCVEDAAPDAVSVRIWKPAMWEEIVETLGGKDSRRLG